MDKEQVIVVEWWTKWRYMIFWVAAGIIYLSAVDEWQVYAKPMEQVKSWYEDIKRDFRQAGNVRAEEETFRATVSGTEEITVSGGTALPDGDGAVVPDAGSTVTLAGDDLLETESLAEETGEPQPEGADGGVVYCTVEDDYFSDAVFIGDSRTVGMFEYGGLEDTADFYASTGLTVYKMFDSEIVAVEGQKKKISVEQALTENSYAKIYIMIGINEMGTGTVETFAAAYGEAVDHLLELQPDAILYIQGIIKVTTERSEQGDYITNEGIEERNEALARLADNERIFYLDVNPEICDETGGMVASYTFDGVHLKAQYIDIWKTFLKEHAVVRRETDHNALNGWDMEQ